MTITWLEHVREFRALFPGMSWRVALEKAKDSYQRAPAVVIHKDPTERKRNQWMAHVKQFRAENPGMPYKQCLQQARETYQYQKNVLEIPNNADQSATVSG